MNASEVHADITGAGLGVEQSPPEHPNATLINGLRELADFLESRPVPGLYEHNTFNINYETKGQLLAAIAGLGTLEKCVDSENWFAFRKKFGPLNLDWFVARDQICERVPTGKKVVKPIMVQQGEVEVDEFEWRCPPSILSPVCENS